MQQTRTSKLIRRLGVPLVEALLALLCLTLIAQPVQAGIEPASAEQPVIALTFDDEPLWQAPALYSLRVMGAGIAGLVGLDLHDSDPAVENFKRAFESPAPRNDDDGPMFNYVLHPLWGSETYLRARRNGMDRQQSFAFSMTASVAWEYLIESWTEHPSRQDLVYTTGLGWMLGEGRHYLLDRMDKDQQVWADPLYTALDYVDLNAQVDPAGGLSPMLGIGWDF